MDLIINSYDVNEETDNKKQEYNDEKKINTDSEDENIDLEDYFNSK
jgi:hypothetical protein